VRRIVPWLLCVASMVLAPAVPGADATVSELRLRAGDSLEGTLGLLNHRGYRIVFSSALVRPDMKLRAAPKAKRVDELLDEILRPWNLRAIVADNGDWLIVPAMPAKTRAPAPVDEAGSEALEAELQTIDVTASRYGLATPGTGVFIDRSGVEQMPHLADDAVRMLKVLPGVSGGDFSAALNVRGGRREETQLRIDGAEIHGGYHFRDLDGALSVLDTNLVESIDFITGGMTARYGDYMSGLVDMRTRRPGSDDEYRSAAGISFVSAYARTSGQFADGRGAWLASARRGYLDVVMRRVQDDDEQISPRYTDVFTSVFLDLGDGSEWSAHVLLGENNLELVSDEGDEIDSVGDGESTHAWTTLEQRFGERLESSTTLALAEWRERRDAEGEDELRRGDVRADFRFQFLDLRSDWNWHASDRHELLFGVDGRLAQADYDYSLTGFIVNPTVPGGRVDIDRAHDLEPDGSKAGAHLAWRARASDALVLETGVRWDQYRYPEGLSFEAISPRINAVYASGDGEFRAAWGVAHQPQGLHQLQVEDDVTDFLRPERVNQAVLGYTHHFGRGLTARIDVYRKDYDRLRPRFENALDPVQLIPEASTDRIRIDATEAQANGVELSVRRDAQRGLSGWASIALAQAREREPGARWVSRTWEQRRTLSFGASWSGAKWNLNLAGIHHSGAPTTSLAHRQVPLPGGQLVDVVVAGPRNGERLDSYSRLDLRASRSVEARNFRFNYYLEVTNLMSRENPCCIESYHLVRANDRTWLEREEGHWLPMLPSFGFQFEF
jgi:hypothetical protein